MRTVTEAVPAAGDRVAAHCRSGRGAVDAARAGAGSTPFGTVATEVEHLIAEGLPAEAAVGAASRTVSAFLGLTGLTMRAPWPPSPSTTPTRTVNTPYRGIPALSCCADRWSADGPSVRRSGDIITVTD